MATKKTAKKQPAPAPAPAPDLSSASQWTNGGDEVLIVKCVSSDGESYGGFRWPLTVGATVEAPDWNVNAECGGGLHGWPWALSLGDGKQPDWAGKWIVFGAKPDDVVSLGGKVKARVGVIRFVGCWQAATNFVLAGQMALVAKLSSGAASSTGDRGAASSTGDRGAASSTGYGGAASSTGDSGAASSTGDSGAAMVTGLSGRVRGGPFGCVALAWWNSAENRTEMRCAEVGTGDGSDGKLKSNCWYGLDDSGHFTEVTQC